MFIEDNYNWFLPTYDSYKFPIQRVDVMRYFIIRYYGGIYLDLDNVSWGNIIHIAQCVLRIRNGYGGAMITDGILQWV